MEKENKTQTQSAAAAQGAQAQTETSAAAGLGKFKSVDALLNAYNSLEAEFTRRSQRLRELEERLRAENDTPAQAAGDTERAVNRGKPEQAAPRAAEVERELADKVRRIAEEYFAARERAANEKASAPYIMAEGGSFSAAPAVRARSLDEAGRLAAEFFRKNG